MTPEGVIDMAQLSIYTLLWVAGPVMAIALAVGLIISLFQALTSIQEMTLTFVPKILVVFGSLLFLMPMMSDYMNQMATEVFSRIAGQ